MRIIVIGCGRVGSRLAATLDRQGHEMTVVDPDVRALDRLGPGFGGRKVAGDGLDRAVLDRLGIGTADGLAAVAGSDELNAVIARLASTTLGVPRVVARIYDPRQAEIYRRLGVQTICQVSWGSARLAELLTASELTPRASIGTGDVEIVDATVPAFLDGRPVSELAAPGQAEVVAITRRGQTVLSGGPATPLEAGDIVHVAVTDASHLHSLLARH